MCCRIGSVVKLACLWAATSLVTGCTRSGAPAGAGNAANGTVAGIEELVIGEGIADGNLKIFPVSTKALRDADRFITLDQGIKDGVVEVQELGTDGNAQAPNSAAQSDSAPPGNAQERAAPLPGDAARTVLADDPFGAPVSNLSDVSNNPTNQSTAVTTENPPAMNASAAAGEPAPSQSPDVSRVAVINRSDRPLYLMPGEIVVGGQQDRAVGQEYIIEAKTGPIPIDVFCVEHGRWQAKGSRELSLIINQSQSVGTQGETIAVTPEAADPAKAAEASAQGRFVATAGSLGKHGRLAVQEA